MIDTPLFGHRILAALSGEPGPPGESWKSAAPARVGSPGRGRVGAFPGVRRCRTAAGAGGGRAASDTPPCPLLDPVFLFGGSGRVILRLRPVRFFSSPPCPQEVVWRHGEVPDASCRSRLRHLRSRKTGRGNRDIGLPRPLTAPRSSLRSMRRTGLCPKAVATAGTGAAPWKAGGRHSGRDPRTKKAVTCHRTPQGPPAEEKRSGGGLVRA